MSFELVVDPAPNPKLKCKSEDMERHVRFSQFCEMTIIPRDEMESKTYSSDEYHRFRREFVNDTQTMARLLTIASAEAISRDDLYRCIGIKQFLTRGFARQVHERMQRHIDTIITRQASTRKDELAALSECSSSWARERAKGYANKYDDVLNE